MGDEDGVKPKGLTVNLVGRSREVIEGIRADTGIPQRLAMIRILEWFAGLDRKFRLAVLSNDAETKEELARLALWEMAGLGDLSIPEKAAASSVTPDDAAILAHAMVNRLQQALKAYRREIEDRPRKKADKNGDK